MKCGQPSAGEHFWNAEYFVKKMKSPDAKVCGKIFNYFSLNNQDRSSALNAQIVVIKISSVTDDSALLHPDNA